MTTEPESTEDTTEPEQTWIVPNRADRRRFRRELRAQRRRGARLRDQRGH